MNRLWAAVILAGGASLLLWSATDAEDSTKALNWAIVGALLGATAGWVARRSRRNWGPPVVAVPLVFFFLLSKRIKYEDVGLQWQTLSLAFLTLFGSVFTYLGTGSTQAGSTQKNG